MTKLMKMLWKDEGGFILSTEAMILWTIVVLGMVVGLVAVRDAAVTELTEVANTILTFDQTYGYDGAILYTNGAAMTGEVAMVSGSQATDYPGTTGGVVTTPTWFGLGSSGVQIPVQWNQQNVISISVP